MHVATAQAGANTCLAATTTRTRGTLPARSRATPKTCPPSCSPTRVKLSRGSSGPGSAACY
eukprot:9329783-Prorocentrum_lima.AAC.1